MQVSSKFYDAINIIVCYEGILYISCLWYPIDMV